MHFIQLFGNCISKLISRLPSQWDISSSLENGLNIHGSPPWPKEVAGNLWLGLEKRDGRGCNQGKRQDHSLSYHWVKKLQIIQKKIYLLDRLHRAIKIKRQKTVTFYH